MPSEKVQEAINEIRAAEGDSVTLYFMSTFREEDDAKCLAEGIKEARVPLTLSLQNNVIGEAGVKCLAEGIKEARVPLTLDLHFNRIGAVGAKFLSEATKKARVPLTLSLIQNGIGEAGAKFFSEGIKEARVPLTLSLQYNNIGEAGVKFLSEGIKEARVPLILGLQNNVIGEAGAKFLSEGIKEARVPLILGLQNNVIGEAGAKFLSEGIKEARFSLTLNLYKNDIGGAGAKFLSEGIKEAQAPLTLNLGNNNIGDAGAKCLSEGIKEARVPLTLYMGSNVVGEAGAKFLSEGIKEARFPLTLDLHFNGIGAVGAKFLSEAIKEARVPLKLSYDEVMEVYDNFIIDAGRTPSEFFAKLKFNPFNLLGLRPILIQMPVVQELLGLNYPKDIALIIQDYDPDSEYLAWKAVEAIRAVEGASRDNTYDSINYDLLTKVYSIAPVEAVASVPEGAEMEDDVQEESNSAPQRRLAEKPLRPRKRKRASDQEAIAEQAAEARPHKERRKAEPQENGPTRYSLRSHKRKNNPEQEEFKGQGTLAYTDNSYPEYYNSGLNQVLKLRLSVLTNAISLKPRYFGNGLSYEASRLAFDVGAILSQGKQVIVPINLYNKHWVGLLFKGFGDRIEVTYMDPEQATMLPGLRSGLENGLLLKGYESRIEEARLTPQSYNNCGYEVIENFVYYLTGTRATQGGALYVQSLLVENSLLDPEIYGLKIEENTRLIKFLSNVEPMAINEITLFAEQRGETKHERTVPNGNSLAKLTTDLYRATILFKALDFAVDSARLVQEPSLTSLKKLGLDYAYLQAMVYGVNSYSTMIAGAETLYQLQLGEYQKAFNVASSTMSAIALSVILAMANRPYLGIAYGAWIATSTAYGAITNAYSFALEFSDKDAALRSAMAYKDLAVVLAASPLHAVYDFEPKVKEYKLQINDILFEKEKSIVQAQIKGEFAQKVFDYIHLPELLEKYVLLNGVIRGELTEEKAQRLKSKPIVISYGALEYDHCVRTEDHREAITEHYYCCNIVGQTIDHVVLTGRGDLEILESL